MYVGCFCIGDIMNFIDEAQVEVIAGKGGNGLVSFRREKYIPLGGPDGGDGGDGGSIFLVGNRAENTLSNLRNTRLIKGQSGTSGQSRHCFGKKGEDLFVDVPLGTIVHDLETQELLGELVSHGQKFMVARGGERGVGNVRFKSSTNRAPRKATNGDLGERRKLKLELRVMADVGLLGGKSKNRL